MDNEKIKKLAKEYVEDALDEWCTKELQIVEPWHCVVEDLSHIAVSAIQKLLETHCIVEKEKARELARLTIDNGHSVDYGLIDGLTDWVLENFSEEYREEAEK